MKYFSPSYWFKLWVLSAPLFNSENQGINAKSIDNKKIKDWTSNNTTNLDLVNEQLNLSNDNQTNFINYQNYSDIQQNNNLNPISPYKHRHEKSRNKHKRGINGGNEIEYNERANNLYCSFKPEWWEEIVELKLNNNKENFAKKFKDKCFNGVWMDNRIERRDFIENLGECIYDNFWTIANKFIDSSRKQRIRIIVLLKYTGWEIWNHDVGIRIDDSSYYSNKYFDNLQRDFPIWNSYEKFNLGIINYKKFNLAIIGNDDDNDFKQAIKQKYPNFNVNQASIVDKTDYSHFNNIFSAKISVIPGYYSYGDLRPTFTYVTQTKLNELNNSIANDRKVKQWINHINEWNSTLPQAIENAKTFTPQALYNWKRNEKEIIKGYIRDWSYISTLIEHEWKLDELNKNVQGLKVEFDILKNQVNDLDRRVQNLENRSNWNCANTVAVVGGASSLVPVIGPIASAVATVTSGVCAIGGV